MTECKAVKMSVIFSKEKRKKPNITAGVAKQLFVIDVSKYDYYLLTLFVGSGTYGFTFFCGNNVILKSLFKTYLLVHNCSNFLNNFFMY